MISPPGGGSDDTSFDHVGSRGRDWVPGDRRDTASADWDGWRGRPYGHHHRHYDGLRYYAPPPVYYVPPSVNFGFTFR